MVDELKRTVLDEAGHITSGDRRTHYGHPRDNHECTAYFWTAYRIRRASAMIDRAMVNADEEERFRLEIVKSYLYLTCDHDSRDVCWQNALQKASRDANLRVRDNLVDVCGYMRNAEQVEEAE